LSHYYHVLAGFVVPIAVGEHGGEVIDAFLAAPIVVVFQTLPDGAKIHRLCDDLVVVLQQTHSLLAIDSPITSLSNFLNRCATATWTSSLS